MMLAFDLKTKHIFGATYEKVSVFATTMSQLVLQHQTFYLHTNQFVLPKQCDANCFLDTVASALKIAFRSKYYQYESQK